jgi:pyridoxamine 5'-phosphate oxidase
MTGDPIDRFKEWLEEARQDRTILEPTAMALATVNARLQPSARMVLLKEVDGRGFTFYTNLESRKSADIRQNTSAALCFYWPPLLKQVRVEGKMEAVDDAEADAYFVTRPRDSQIGAWASKQSSVLPDMKTLEQAVGEYIKKFEGKTVPRPPFWSGWRVVPESIEFWTQGAFRLHDRDLYTRIKEGWQIKKLYP